MLDLDFSAVAAKSNFLLCFTPCPLASGAQSKGDHVRRLVIIAAAGRLRLSVVGRAEVRSSYGYL